MCRATLLPEPESPLTMIRRIGSGPQDSRGPRLEHVLRVVIARLLLVLLDAAVELVGERVDRRVHVAFRRLREDLVPAQPQRRLGLVTQLLYRQDAMHVYQLLK